MLAHVCWCSHSIHIIAQTCIDMHRHYAEYTSVDKVYMVVDQKVLVRVMVATGLHVMCFEPSPKSLFELTKIKLI